MDARDIDPDFVPLDATILAAMLRQAEHLDGDSCYCLSAADAPDDVIASWATHPGVTVKMGDPLDITFPNGNRLRIVRR